jgi:ABC-type nickel/cobalt efflux system permease component RcnA
VSSICLLQLLGSSGILLAGIAWIRICSTALVSQIVLVLSETVLVLVIESSLSWRYVRSTIDLPLTGTKLGNFLFPAHEQEQEQEHEHEHEHEHGASAKSLESSE